MPPSPCTHFDHAFKKYSPAPTCTPCPPKRAPRPNTRPNLGTTLSVSPEGRWLVLWPVLPGPRTKPRTQSVAVKYASEHFQTYPRGWAEGGTFRGRNPQSRGTLSGMRDPQNPWRPWHGAEGMGLGRWDSRLELELTLQPRAGAWQRTLTYSMRKRSRENEGPGIDDHWLLRRKRYQ